MKSEGDNIARGRASNGAGGVVIEYERPKAVVQIFANHLEMVKSRWRSGEWRAHTAWNGQCISYTGWASSDGMILNDTILNRREILDACDTILLIDANNYTVAPSHRGVIIDMPGGIAGADGVHPAPVVDHESDQRDSITAHYYFLSRWPGLPMRYGSYDLMRGASGMELHVAGSRRALRGPRRGDYKAADLRVGMPVRTIMNGRTEAPLDDDSRYRYQEDIFIYLGDFNRLVVHPASEIAITKKVPYDAAKVINLEKDLL